MYLKNTTFIDRCKNKNKKNIPKNKSGFFDVFLGVFWLVFGCFLTGLWVRNDFLCAINI
jgi:hypothetical protein